MVESFFFFRFVRPIFRLGNQCAHNFSRKPEGRLRREMAPLWWWWRVAFQRELCEESYSDSSARMRSMPRGDQHLRTSRLFYWNIRSKWLAGQWIPSLVIGLGSVSADMMINCGNFPPQLNDLYITPIPAKFWYDITHLLFSYHHHLYRIEYKHSESTYITSACTGIECK